MRGRARDAADDRGGGTGANAALRWASGSTDEVAPLGAEVRGEGLLIGLELGEPVANEVVQARSNEKLIVNDVTPTTIRLAPPLIVSDAEVEDAVERFARRRIESESIDARPAAHRRPRAGRVDRDARDGDRDEARSVVGRRRRAPGKVVAVLFEKPSLRTRFSVEAALARLGAHPIGAYDREVGLGSREPIDDAAHVLERYVDAIVMRTFGHDARRSDRASTRTSP